MRAMRIRVALLGALALAACTKKEEAPAGRPKDVCAGVTAQLDCAESPPDAQGYDAARNCYDVGNQQFHCGLFADAAKSLAKSAELKPDARTFHALGDAWFLQESWQAAHDAYRKAVDLDGKKRDSWVRLSQVNLRLHQLADAHEAAKRALALDPNKPDALRADADAFSAEGEYDKAVDGLHKAAALGNEQVKRECAEQEVQILQLKIRKLRRAKAQEEAVADAEGQLADALDKLVAQSPPAASVLRELAEARLAAGQLQQAEDALDKAAKLDPKDFVSPRLVGFLREQRGDGAGARTALQASLQVQPKQAMPYIVLGRLDAASGDAAAAQKDFAQALANVDGKDPHETRQLAELALKVGDAAKAEALYQSLDDDPDLSLQVGFWLDQARVSEQLGHGEAVKKACKKANAIVESAACPPKEEKR